MITQLTILMLSGWLMAKCFSDWVLRYQVRLLYIYLPPFLKRQSAFSCEIFDKIYMFLIPFVLISHTSLSDEECCAQEQRMRIVLRFT